VSVAAEMQAYLSGTAPAYASEYRGGCKDGSWKWVLARGAIVARTPEGHPLRVVGTHADITQRKRAEQALRDANAFQQAVFDSLDARIAVIDQHGTIVQINSAWHQTALAGSHAGSTAYLGRDYLQVLASIADDDEPTLTAAKAGIDSVRSGAATGFKLDRPFYAPGCESWFDMKVTAVPGEQERMVVSHENVSDLKAAELASLLLANTDTLTGALSRRNFLSLADQELARSLRYELPLMVLMLDLDHFKDINDQLGHAAGDAVLQSFVRTVRSVLRESDLIGRLGGEEFAVLLPNTNLEGGRALGQRIIDCVRASPVAAGSQRVSYTVSAGAASFSGQRTFSVLLNLADIALYRAKHRGRDCLEMAVAVSGHEAADQGHPGGSPAPT